MAFSGMINLKSGQLTLGGQFEAYKRGQLERKIQSIPEEILNQNDKKARKRQIREMLKKITDPGEGIRAGNGYDLYSILEAKLMLEN